LEWKKKYNDDPPKPGQMEAAAKVVREHLTGLPEGVEDIASKRLKKAVNVNIGTSTWPLVVKAAIEGTDWKPKGQRILRGETLFKTHFAE
jgi:hypothetical protein